MVTLTFILTRLNLVAALLPLLTLKRVLNLIHAIVRFLLRTATTVKHPAILILTVTTRCNYSCVMCLKSSTSDSRKGDLMDYRHPREMDLDNLSAFLREHADYLCMVHLHGGEPLHYRKIVPLVDLLNTLRIPFDVITNGSLLSPELSDRLVGQCCFHIGFSLDAGTEETYRTVRRGGHLPLVLANIAYLNQRKKERKSMRPVLSASMCTFRFNIAEIRDLIEICRAYAIPSLSVVEGWNYDTPGVQESDYAMFNKELFRTELAAARACAKRLGIIFRSHFPSLAELPAGMNPRIFTPPRNCLNLYASVWLLPDFSAVGCSNSHLSYGNVAESGLNTVWNGDESTYTKARIALRKGTVPEPCRECIYSGTFFS